MANVEDRVRALIIPLLEELDVDLFDVEHAGGRLVVTVDAEGGVSSGQLYHATKAVSRAMDEHDPISSSYTLEVTSPGLERKLRRPRHWQRSVGEDVNVKVPADFNEKRRIRGRLVAADDTTATVQTDSGDELEIPYAVVQKAKTVFEWGPTPKKGGKANQQSQSKKSKPKKAEAS